MSDQEVTAGLERQQFIDLVADKYRNYQRGQVWWSFLYNGSLFLAPVGAFLSTVAIFGGASQTLKAIAAAVTTLFTTIAAQGRFQDKWRANRIARSGLEAIRIDLGDPAADLHALRQTFKSIVKTEDLAILGPVGDKPGPDNEENGGPDQP
jgi:hypothetical protein